MVALEGVGSCGGVGGPSEEEILDKVLPHDLPAVGLIGDDEEGAASRGKPHHVDGGGDGALLHRQILGEVAEARIGGEGAVDVVLAITILHPDGVLVLRVEPGEGDTEPIGDLLKVDVDPVVEGAEGGAILLCQGGLRLSDVDRGNQSGEGLSLTLESDDHLLLSGGAGGERAEVEERQVAACPGDEVTLADAIVVRTEEEVLGELQLRHRNLAYEASLLVEGEESCLPYL